MVYCLNKAVDHCLQRNIEDIHNMNQKVFSSWLFALILFLPLGVWAEDGNDHESCWATHSLSERTLIIPCVEVVMAGGESVFYSVHLQQLATDVSEFALTQVLEKSEGVVSNCTARYSLETGELVVPCVEVVTSSQTLEISSLVLHVHELSTPIISTENSAEGKKLRNASRSGGSSDLIQKIVVITIIAILAQSGISQYTKYVKPARDIPRPDGNQ